MTQALERRKTGMSEEQTNENIISFSSSRPTRQPHNMILTDSQAFNLCCGLLLGRFTDKLPDRVETNNEVSTIFARSYTDAYSLYLSTNKDGNPRHPASVSVYVVGGENAEPFTMQELNIELVLKNPESQPFFSSSSLPGPISSLSLKSTRDFVLNHCPIISVSLVDPQTDLTITQAYSPAHADTSATGSVTIYHEQNLRVKITSHLVLTPGCQERLFDLELTWKEKETLYMADTQQEEEFKYLCGEIQIEAGKNTYYPSGTSRTKVEATPCALMFGDPNSRKTQKEIADILERGTELPANSDIPISGTEQAEIKGGYVEYSFAVPYSEEQEGTWEVAGGGGLGTSWSIDNTDQEDEDYPIRHRVYFIDSGNWDTGVTVYDANNEQQQDIVAETKVVSEPTVPRPANAKNKYYQSRLALQDDATIIVRAPQTPEVDEHLVITDDADISVTSYVPPERDEHLIIIDDIDLEVVNHPIPHHSDSLSLTDDVDIDVYTPPVPIHSDSLVLDDDADITVVTPPNPNVSDSLVLSDTVTIETV